MIRSFVIPAATLLLAACASAPDLPITSSVVASQVPTAIASRLQQIGRVVAPPPTAELYAPLQEREPYAGVKVTRDISYGSDPRHLLDVFVPEATVAPAKPVLVFVHGGAFTRGDRRAPGSPFYDNIAIWAVRNGMVGVNITYRLAPQNQWPAAQEDLAAALRWVRQNVGALGGDPERIVLMGHSAGAAHVAQYLGHSQFHVAPGSGVAGAILVSGLFDMTTAEVNPPLQAYFGTDPLLYAQRSALPGLLRSQVPLLLAYAELDPQDFHNQSQQAAKALCDAGRCAALLLLTGHSHMSEIYVINTADTALTAPMRRFIMGR